MAKNQHTFAKRQREMDKKRKAEEKRTKRREKKEGIDATDDPSAQGETTEGESPAGEGEVVEEGGAVSPLDTLPSRTAAV